MKLLLLITNASFVSKAKRNLGRVRIIVNLFKDKVTEWSTDRSSHSREFCLCHYFDVTFCSVCFHTGTTVCRRRRLESRFLSSNPKLIFQMSFVCSPQQPLLPDLCPQMTPPKTLIITKFGKKRVKFVKN